MVTIDPSDEAPEGLTGEEFIEWMKEHKKKPVPTERAASEEEVEAIAKPKIKGKRVGQMQASKGGKPAGETTEYGGHEGIDASKETFMGRHPKLAKAVDVGKKVAGKVGEFVDEEMIHHGAAERKKPTEEEIKEKKKKTQKELSSIEKELQEGFLGEDGGKSKKGKKGEKNKDDDDDDEDTPTSKKQKILAGNYEPAYSGQGGLLGKGGYESAYKSGWGMGSYQPAYKQKEQPRTSELATPNKVKSAVEEIPTTPQPAQRKPDRFNLQNWQSMGFPNTLPQSARGNLFRPAPPPHPTPQPVVTPMVRQPYQPQPMPQPMRAPTRAPLSGPMPRIGLSLNVPQLMRPRAINPMRAPTSPTKTIVPKTAQMSFMGVTFGEKKKQEPNKPLTRMGEGYKNVPLVVMNGLYPNAGYNPKTDSMTKKSIIPKIKANITPNNFTMFGMRMKKKNI